MRCSEQRCSPEREYQTDLIECHEFLGINKPGDYTWHRCRQAWLDYSSNHKCRLDSYHSTIVVSWDRIPLEFENAAARWVCHDVLSDFFFQAMISWLLHHADRFQNVQMTEGDWDFLALLRSGPSRIRRWKPRWGIWMVICSSCISSCPEKSLHTWKSMHVAAIAGYRIIQWDFCSEY